MKTPVVFYRLQVPSFQLRPGALLRGSLCALDLPLYLFFLLPSLQLSRPPGPASAAASQSIPLSVTSNLTSATTMTIHENLVP